MVKKRPVSLRLSVTDRCQLHCLYCRPPGAKTEPGTAQPLRREQIARFVQVVSQTYPITKIHLTGGEPLLRSDLVKLVGDLRHVAPAVTLALTTNGQLLAKQVAALQAAGLNRVNISLDSLDPETYASNTHGGNLTATLAGINVALEQGLSPIKINTTVLAGVNDHEILAIAEYALSHGVEARFLELMPIGPVAARYEELFVSADWIRETLTQTFELEALPHQAGQSSRSYRVRDREGRIGFIASSSHPFCEGCRRLRLTASGELIACLARGTGSDLRPLLEQNDANAHQRLLAIVDDALASKTQRDRFTTPKTMMRVGG